MADVPGKFFSARKVRTGVSPSSPGSLVGESVDPVNPPGTSLTSVGVSMPAAFAVANSPLTSNGTIAVTGAGTVAQYVRGDGTLADFPESSGGGSSVSYYLNGSVSQGTIGGVAYKEMNKVPVLGAGTDFTIAANGYISSFITDSGDPNLLEIPGGNWNFESYFSSSSSGGSPTFYVELYKVNAGGTATLIASSSAIPELIAFGTNITPYFSSLAVPTTVLDLTDRLAVRYYVTHSGRTITLHTEGPHLCQIITTFTTGLTSLNGLNAQVQFFAVGTSGTDFNIASATATHTFNLPTASATNRGALSSTDWTTFNNKENAITAGTTAQYFRGDKTFQTLNTSVVPEGTNLYYTEARVNANANVAANTAARHNAVTLGTANGLSLSTQILSLGLASAGVTGALSGTDWTTFNNKTSNVGTVTSVAATAGTGISISGSPITTSGTLTITNTAPDQVVALTASTGISVSGTYPNFTITNTSPSSGGTVTSVGLSSATSGVTIGSTPITTSGTITLAIATASGSQNGLLSSTDWTTFNGKQNALTNPVTGTGTTNYLPKFTGSTSIGNSLVFDDGTNVGINTAIPGRLLTLYKSSTPILQFVDNVSGTGASNGFLLYIGGLDAYLENTSNGFMSFQNNGAERMRITSGGRVLIGTPPPTESTFQLDVNGTGRFSGALTLTAAANRINSGNELRFYRTDNAIYTQLYDGGNTNGFVLDNRNGEGFSFQSAGSNQLRIASTGVATFVGNILINNIGTTIPNIGSTSSQGGLNLYSGASVDYNGGALITLVSSDRSGAYTRGELYISAGRATNNTANGFIEFSTGDTSRMKITSGGNVLIGNIADNGSKLRLNGSFALPHVTKSANYTLDATDYTVGFDCASNRTANLPDATTCAGRIYVIYQYNTGAGARSVTLDGNGSQTINGMTTYSLSPFCDLTSVMIQSNGSNWIIIASNFTVDCM